MWNAASSEAEVSKKPVKQQCRHVLASGRQCNRVATRGQATCYLHQADERGRAAARLAAGTTLAPDAPLPLDIPLLDNREAISLTITNIARLMSSGTCNDKRGGKLLYAMNMALRALPPVERPAKQKQSQQAEAAVPEEVEEVTLCEGEWLAPASRYWGPNGRPEPRWDLSRWMYVSSKKKKMVQDVTPQEVAETEFPEEGWMTDDELEHPKVLTEKLQRWREEDKREAERLKQQGSALSAQGSENQATASRQQGSGNGVQGTALSVQTRGLDIQAVGEISARCRKMRVPHVSQRHGMHINHSTDLGGPFKPSFGLSGVILRAKLGACPGA